MWCCFLTLRGVQKSPVRNVWSGGWLPSKTNDSWYLRSAQPLHVSCQDSKFHQLPWKVIVCSTRRIFFCWFRDKSWPRERSTFSIEDGPPPDDDNEQGYEAPDQTVFDLTMDYSDDETLLDWEQYAGQRKFYFLGMDCSLVARFCPFMPCVPREWYHRSFPSLFNEILRVHVTEDQKLPFGITCDAFPLHWKLKQTK